MNVIYEVITIFKGDVEWDKFNDENEEVETEEDEFMEMEAEMSKLTSDSVPAEVIYSLFYLKKKNCNLIFYNRKLR